MQALDRQHPAAQLLQIRSNEIPLLIPTELDARNKASLVLHKGVEAFLYVRNPASKSLNPKERVRFAMVSDPLGQVNLVHFSTGLKLCSIPCGFADLDAAQICLDSLVRQHGLDIMLATMRDAVPVNA